MIGSEDPEYLVGDEEVFQAQVEMFMYAQTLAEKRRADPQDDIITALLSAEVDGDSLSDMDFNLFFLLLSVAGNETTRNAISHALWLLTQFGDQRTLLTDDFEGRIGGAVEEIVRYASPVMFMRRTLTRDYTMGGHDYATGDKAVLFYWAANRDEGLLGEVPDTIRIVRTRSAKAGVP